MRTVPRPVLRRVAFAVAVAVVFAGVLELAARIALPRAAIPVLFSPLDAALNSTQPEFFRAHPTLFWELVPNVRRYEPTFWGDVTNADGLRMRRDVSGKDGRLRVACFGDSCTYGLGGPVDDAWPSLLAADPALDVINAGVVGYSTYQGALMADMRCPEWKPDVVVVEYGVNDALAWMQIDRGEVVAPTDVERAPHVRAEALLHKSVLLGWLASIAAPRPRAVPSDLVNAANEASATKGPVEARSFAAAREMFKNGADRLPARVPPDAFRANLARIAAHAPYAIVLDWPRRRRIDPTTKDEMSEERLAPYEKAIRESATDRVDVLDLAPPLVASKLTGDQAYYDAIHARRPLSQIVADAVRAKIRARMGR